MKLLYVCTHNACRSILAEVLTRATLNDRVQVRSAGSSPGGQVHPLTLRYLEEHGYSTAGLASESLGAMREFDPDIVVTVCDSAAGEACPVWLAPAARVHWGLPDPSRAEGDDNAKLAAFEPVVQIIANRLSALSKMDLTGAYAEQLAATMQELEAVS